MIHDNQLNLYGEMQSEKLAADNKVSHQIVSEINQFGVNDRQRWLIIYQLALEFENVQDMKDLSSFVKEKKGSEIFISKIYSLNKEEEEI